MNSMEKSTPGVIFSESKWIFYLMAFFIGIALGIITPLAATHMSKNGTGSVGIGIVESVYFLFIALGALFVNRKMLNKDLKTLIFMGLVLTAVSAMVFPLLAGILLWLISMAGAGIGISFYMIGAQTILHSLADERSRGTVSGVFSTFTVLGAVLGLSGGPMVYGIASWIPFMVSGICLLLACLIMVVKLKQRIIIPGHQGRKVFAKICFALNAILAYSFIETTLAALFPVFLLREGYNMSQIGVTLGIFALGSFVGTVPFTTMADKIGREKGLCLSVILSAAGLAGIPIVHSYPERLILSVIAGVGVGPIYPLSMAINAQSLEPNELQAGMALFTSVYGLGSTVGPFLSSLVMGILGVKYIFSLCFALSAVVLVHAAFYISKKGRVGRENSRDLP